MRRRTGLVALLALAATPAAAQQRGRPDPNPDASVEIEQVRVGVLALGGSVGGGRLRFRGEEHRFTVRGLEFGSVGVSSLSARGEVFGLRWPTLVAVALSLLAVAWGLSRMTRMAEALEGSGPPPDAANR
jgi:hypothetical protein